MVTNIFTTIRQLVKNFLAIACFGMVILFHQLLLVLIFLFGLLHSLHQVTYIHDMAKEIL